MINATSAGHGGSAIRLSRDWFSAQGVCYDMNYGAAAKPLRTLCLDKGITYSDGLGMLVGQAALSFKLWTGLAPDTSAVLEVLRRGVTPRAGNYV
jgi:shikimate dehydrogenase